MARSVRRNNSLRARDSTGQVFAGKGTPEVSALGGTARITGAARAGVEDSTPTSHPDCTVTTTAILPGTGRKGDLCVSLASRRPARARHRSVAVAHLSSGPARRCQQRRGAHTLKLLHAIMTPTLPRRPERAVQVRARELRDAGSVE